MLTWTMRRTPASTAASIRVRELATAVAKVRRPRAKRIQ